MIHNKINIWSKLIRKGNCIGSCFERSRGAHSLQVVIVIIYCCIVIAIIIIAITRDLEKAQAAKDEIEAATKTKVWGFQSHKKPQNLSVKGDDKGSVFKILQVHLHQLDLSSQPSVRACAQGLTNTLARIDVLINNAGVIINRITHGDHNDERG